MVWLHGGGFSAGSANEAQVDGENLSRLGDVVVVGVNHRLGVYGHLNLSSYGEKYRYSANVGMMDVVDALKWLKENAASFGGDPDNITLFGESGGGAKVLTMMCSPYAKGLFRRGIVESGATEGIADTVAGLWASFARDGVPALPGVDAWEPYTRESGAVMILDDETYLAHHHDEKLLSLLAPDDQW